jgi:hypothetical protein
MNFFVPGVEKFNTDISMTHNQERNILNFQRIGSGGQYEYFL